MQLRVLTTTILILGAVAAGQGSAGQLPPDRSHTQPEPLFAAESELVVLHVMVKDRKGSYVSGLSRDAFGIVEDGQPQTVHLFNAQEAPVTVGLLIDSSGSMHAARDLVIAAAGTFADLANPQDELFALAFNEHVRAAFPPTAPFTGDPNILRAAMVRTVGARGRTALHDALSAGLDYLTRGTHERRVLIVVSDGGDNASTSTFDGVLAKAQASNAVVYTVGLIDDADRDANPKRLKQIAEASGGEAFLPDDARDVADVLRRIARDIRNTYSIGYTPTNTARDGRFRSVRVDVRPPDGRSLVVRTRRGYFAGLNTSQK